MGDRRSLDQREYSRLKSAQRIIVVSLADLLRLYLHYSEENRELAIGNGMISVGGLCHGWRSGWQTDFEICENAAAAT